MIKKKDIVPLLGIAVFLWLFYVATCMYPICSDDMSYVFKFGTSERIQNLRDVFVSQAHHYVSWGGRFVSHCAVQSALLFGKEWFNLVNVFTYAVTSWAVVAISGKGRNMWYWLMAVMSLWVMMPHSGSTMFWLTGTFNYLLPSCLSALFLCCLFSQSIWVKRMALGIGLVAGNGHECISIGLTVALVLYVIIASKQDKMFYAGVLCYLIGTISNVMAPGNFQRFAGGAAFKEDMDLCQMIVGCCKTGVVIVWQGIFKETDFAFRGCVGLWCISLVMAVREVKKGEKQYVFPLCVLFGALSTLVLNIVTKCVYPRSLYGFCFLAYISFFFMLSRVSMQRKSQILTGCFMLGLIALNVVEIPKAYRSITILRAMYEQIEKYAIAQHTIVPEVPGWQEAKTNKYVEAFGVFPSVLRNNAIRRYYHGIEMSILPQFVCDSVSRFSDTLSRSEIHQRVNADGGVWFMKLKQRPLRVSISKYQQPAIPAFIAPYVHQLAVPRLVVKDISIICVGNAYYACGESRDSAIPLVVVYSEQEKITIPTN